MKNILIALCVLLSIECAHAQSYMSANYTMSLPMDNLSDFTDEFSFRGVTLDYKSVLFPHVSIGASAGWQVFYQRLTNATYTDNGNTSMSGAQYRYVNSVPLFITGNYFFALGNLRPYAGVGVGAIWAERRLDIGLYSLKEDNWRFALAPELGVMYSLRPGVGINLSARYHQAFKTEATSSLSYLSFNVGVIFSRRE